MWIWHNFTFGLQTEQSLGGAVALGIMKITLFLRIESCKAVDRSSAELLVVFELLYF